MKTKKYIACSLFILMPFLCVIVPGCSEKNDLYDLPVPLKVEVRELFLDQKRQPGLMVETFQDYECSNYVIDFEYTQTNENRLIDFKGILLPAMCLTAIGPATAFVYLNEMHESIHETHFLINDELLKTNFEVLQDQINVFVTNNERSGLIKFADKTITRLSNDYIWGHLTPVTDSSHPYYDDFFEKISQAGAKKENLEVGNYGFFRITDSEMIIFDHEKSYHTTLPFIFTYNGQFEPLKEIADSFSNVYIIDIYTANGDYYRNK